MSCILYAIIVVSNWFVWFGFNQYMYELMDKENGPRGYMNTSFTLTQLSPFAFAMQSRIETYQFDPNLILKANRSKIISPKFLRNLKPTSDKRVRI